MTYKKTLLGSASLFSTNFYQEVCRLLGLKSTTRGDHRSCAVFGDNRRPAITPASRKRSTGDYVGLHAPAGKPHAGGRNLPCPAARFDLHGGELFRRCHAATQAESHNLDLALRSGVAVATFVLRVEAREQIGSVAEVDLISLPSITKVGGRLKDDLPLPAFLREFRRDALAKLLIKHIE